MLPGTQDPSDGAAYSESVVAQEWTHLPHLAHHHRHHHRLSPIADRRLQPSEPTVPETPLSIRPKPARSALLVSATLGAAIALLIVLTRAFLG